MQVYGHSPILKIPNFHGGHRIDGNCPGTPSTAAIDGKVEESSIQAFAFEATVPSGWLEACESRR